MKSFRDFRVLSYQLLQYATLGFLRSDFLREVAKLILDFSECHAVQLLLRERGKEYRCHVGRDKATSVLSIDDVTPAVGQKIEAML